MKLCTCAHTDKQHAHVGSELHFLGCRGLAPDSHGGECACPGFTEFQLGLYQHYKGGRYEVLCLARNSENRDEVLVVYRSLEKGSIWVRPLITPAHQSPHGFLDEVPLPDGTKVPRFKLEVAGDARGLHYSAGGLG